MAHLGLNPNVRTLIYNSETWLSQECHRTQPVCVPFQAGFVAGLASKIWSEKGRSGLIGLRQLNPALKLKLLRWLCGVTAAISHRRQLVFK
jgi:hypothetical protein